MKPEDDILIAQYLRGQLNEIQIADFQERLNSDVEFNKEFEIERQLFDALNEDSWSRLKHRDHPEIQTLTNAIKDDDIVNLRTILKKFPKEENRYNTKRSWIYYVAAASVVILLASQFFFNATLSNEELYKNYIEQQSLPSFF